MKIGLNYRLRSLLILMAVAATLTVACPPFYDWYIHPASVPLSTIVASYNESKADWNSPQDITAEDIVTAIKSQLPTLVESERVKQILRRIAVKQRVPRNAVIEYVSGHQVATNQPHWVINLIFMADGGGRQVSIQLRASHNEDASVRRSSDSKELHASCR